MDLLNEAFIELRIGLLWTGTRTRVRIKARIEASARLG